MNNTTQYHASLLRVMAQQERRVTVDEGESKFSGYLFEHPKTKQFTVSSTKKQLVSETVEIDIEKVSDIRGSTIVMMHGEETEV